MPIRLISLSRVPDDEAEEMRSLLRENNIVFYETPRGDWLGSLNAIWLHDDRHLEKAREILITYQHERKNKARAEYKASENTRKGSKLLNKIKDNLVLYIFYLLVLITLISTILLWVEQ